MKYFVAAELWGEKEGFEEPAGVGEMPFGRADIRHRLDGLVFRRETAGERFRRPAHLEKPLGPSLPIRWVETDFDIVAKISVHGKEPSALSVSSLIAAPLIAARAGKGKVYSPSRGSETHNSVTCSGRGASGAQG